MPPEKSERTDAALLHDMTAAAEAVSRFVSGKSREDYGSDEMLSRRGRAKDRGDWRSVGYPMPSSPARPDIPWIKIMGTCAMLLAHDYDNVNDDIVWRIATVYVPELLEQLRPLLRPPPPDPEPEPPGPARE